MKNMKNKYIKLKGPIELRQIIFELYDAGYFETKEKLNLEDIEITTIDWDVNIGGGEDEIPVSIIPASITKPVIKARAAFIHWLQKQLVFPKKNTEYLLELYEDDEKYSEFQDEGVDENGNKWWRGLNDAGDAEQLRRMHQIFGEDVDVN